jgi:hypothetical protein
MFAQRVDRWLALDQKKEAASTPKMESMPLVVVAYRCGCV